MGEIRPYAAADEEAAIRLGAIAGAWGDCASLRLVAGEPLVGHLQIVDRGTTPVRRHGVCDMYLIVARERRRQGIGSALYERALAFATQRQARRVRTWFDSAEADAIVFYTKR